MNLFCSNCGNQARDGAKFCNKCGSILISSNSEKNNTNINQISFLENNNIKTKNPFKSLSKNPSKSINYETKQEIEEKKQKEQKEYEKALTIYDKVFSNINNVQWEPTPYDWSLMDPETKYGHSPIGNVLNSWSDSFFRNRNPNYNHDYTGEIIKLERCINAFQTVNKSLDKVQICKDTILKIKKYNEANIHLFYQNENWFLFKELNLSQPLPIFESLGDFKNSKIICEKIKEGSIYWICGLLYMIISPVFFIILSLYLLSNQSTFLFVIFFIIYTCGFVFFLKNNGKVRLYKPRY